MEELHFSVPPPSLRRRGAQDRHVADVPFPNSQHNLSNANTWMSKREYVAHALVWRERRRMGREGTREEGKLQTKGTGERGRERERKKTKGNE